MERHTTRLLIPVIALAIGCGSQVSENGSGSGSDSQTSGSGSASASDTSSGPGTTEGPTTNEPPDGSSSTGDIPPGERSSALDVLFIVDDSGSMSVPQSDLAANISSFTGPLIAAGFDTHVAVTTTDAGNLWCQGSSISDPENGAFVGTSCRDRLTDFTFAGQQTLNAEATCLEHCSESWSPDGTWFDASESDGAALDEALGCLLPQGIAGCGFESTLESMHNALLGAPSDFLRPNAHLAIVILTDEADCSFVRGPDNQIMEDVFGMDGPRTFWSLPEENVPTSAVCWNAGVNCASGDCETVDLDPFGNPTSDPNASSLHPIDGYLDNLIALRDERRPNGGELFVYGIVGVPTDYPETGTLTYAEGPDAMNPMSFQARYGIAPGCTRTNGTEIVTEAVPPARMRALIENPEIDGQLFSICSDDMGPALQAMAQDIVGP